MKKFNRVLYAIISDMFESLLINEPNMTDEELMQHIYQEFDETMQLVFNDLESVAQINEIAEINIDGSSYSKDQMIDMIVNGIAYTTNEIKSDSRSLMRYLTKQLDETFAIFPSYAGDFDEEMLIVERRQKIEAHISFDGDKIFLLKGESNDPDIEIFKDIYPEILKWVQSKDRRNPDQDLPPKNKSKTTSNIFDYL